MGVKELLSVISKLREHHQGMCQNVLLFIQKTKKEHESLLKDREMLRALEAAGVDNWEGYSLAVESL
jgi:hypothetical protein